MNLRTVRDVGAKRGPAEAGLRRHDVARYVAPCWEDRQMRQLLIALWVFGLAAPAQSEWATTRVSIHMGPWGSSTDPVVGHLDRGDEVRVQEELQGWARISGYQSAKDVGLKGRRKVAKWVQARHLTTDQPTPLPTACEHPDIAPNALPMGGPGRGITVKEADILCRGAIHMLETGRCQRVEYGEKSMSRPGSYFVNCGGPNIFFTADEVPRPGAPPGP